MAKKPAATPAQPATEAATVEPVEAAAIEAPAPAESDAPAATMTVLRVTARTEGFRRAGLAFGRLPAEIPLDALEPWQVEALKAEPMLQVEEIEL